MTEKDQRLKNNTDEPVSENEGETIRKSGLAYGAAITLFAAILFFLGIGYALDLWLKSAPWGLAGGVVLGAVIGFYQFVRIANQIND